MARDPARVDEAFDAAERAGPGADGGVHVALPPADRAARALARPRVGALRYVRAAFGFGIDPSVANVRWEASLEGGALMDVGCYCVSALRLICGAEPSRVSGELVLGGDGVDARFAGVLRFPGDVLGTFDCGMDVTAGPGSRSSAAKARCGRDPWQAPSPAVVFTRRRRARDAGRGAPSSPTRARSRSSRPRCSAARRRASAAPTRSARPARSTRCTARPPRAARLSCRGLSPRAGGGLGRRRSGRGLSPPVRTDRLRAALANPTAALRGYRFARRLARGGAPARTARAGRARALVRRARRRPLGGEVAPLLRALRAPPRALRRP